MPVNLTIFNDNELHLSFYYSFIKKQFKCVIWKHEDSQQSILRNICWINSGIGAQ